MDEQTAAFFMPPAEDTPGDAPPPVMMAPAPPEEDGYEFAGGPGDGGDEAALFAAPPSDDPFAAPPSNDPFAAPPSDGPAVASDGDVFFAGPSESTAAVMVLDDPSQPVVVGEEESALVEKEPSPMAKWNQEWQVTLKARKDEENQARAAMAEQAQKDMEEFQAQREIKRETKMSRNRAEEQSKLEAMEADLENDNSWQRVIKLVEFQQDTEDKADDITRMRDVMIVLKNDTEKALALA